VRVEQVGGPEPGSRPAWWSRLSVAPLTATLQRSTWGEIAVPLVGGVVLAFGLGLFSRRAGR
jgi:hypothetical protein